MRAWVTSAARSWRRVMAPSWRARREETASRRMTYVCPVERLPTRSTVGLWTTHVGRLSGEDRPRHVTRRLPAPARGLRSGVGAGLRLAGPVVGVLVAGGHDEAVADV